MLWGDRAQIPDSIADAYRGAGIAHILALSGLHVSFIVAGLNALFHARNARLRFALTAALLGLYCAIAAFPASLVRATVMSLCLLHSQVIGRRADAPSSIAFAAIVILAVAPGQLENIGFQLSFAAVAAVASLGGDLVAALPLPKPIAQSVSMTVCGMLGTLPLTAYHFGEVAALTLFANILILPVVPIAFFAAMSTSLVALPLQRVGAFFAPAARLGIGLMTIPAQFIAQFPFALVKVARPSALVCSLCYLAMLAFSRYCLLIKKNRALLAAAFLMAAVMLYLAG
jgi:competence protein ComEC